MERLPDQGTGSSSHGDAQILLMKRMEAVLTQAESEFVERSRLAEAWHVLWLLQPLHAV